MALHGPGIGFRLFNVKLSGTYKVVLVERICGIDFCSKNLDRVCFIVFS